ncbi:MAG: hypothetical protein M1833_005800 [Piccolia ochrophora]|nr:MAG: hypothetical protein M1833_005800 [Piccolia ochrophora]
MFTRNLDSGVWMSSDGLTESVDGDTVQEICAAAEELAAVNGNVEQVDATTTVQSLPPEDMSERASWACAEKIILDCLETGNEMVDLTDLGIRSLPSSLVAPLRYLTKHPQLDAVPPSQEAYSPLVPSVKLFLSRNQLRHVPSAIFNLDNLTVLSLRNNNLLELPWAIGRMLNLIELNVGGNKLRCLPWEILNLLNTGRLNVLSTHPNPFFEPYLVSAQGKETKEFERGAALLASVSEPPQSQRDIIKQQTPSVPSNTEYLAGSMVTFFNPDGSHHRASPIFNASHQQDTVERLRVAPHDYRPIAPSTINTTPSLIELALQSCTRATRLPDLSEYVPQDRSSSLFRLTHELDASREYGPRSCAICDRDYVLARTEWVEWRDCLPFGNMEQSLMQLAHGKYRVPFLRRGCSWRCVPTYPDAK